MCTCVKIHFIELFIVVIVIAAVVVVVVGGGGGGGGGVAVIFIIMTINTITIINTIIITGGDLHNEHKMRFGTGATFNSSPRSAERGSYPFRKGLVQKRAR